MIRRREFIGALSAGTCVLAGCTSGNSSDIIISNSTDKEITGSILVRRIDSFEQTVTESQLSDGELVLEDTFTLQPDGSDGSNVSYSEVSTHEEPVVIHVDIQNGPEGNTKFIDANADSKSALVTIRDDSIGFGEGHD